MHDLPGGGLDQGALKGGALNGVGGSNVRPIPCALYAKSGDFKFHGLERSKMHDGFAT
jgi:hypothetical protein